MLYSAEIDGIYGYCKVSLVDMGNGTERVRLEHRVTTEQMPESQYETLPKIYMHMRCGGLVFPTRIIEYVDVPKGRYVPSQVATELARKHLGPNVGVEWLGRGWSLHYA